LITVRQATPADQDAIFEFIRHAYAGRWQYKIPERWDWIYVNNPYLDEGMLPLWIAVDEHGIVVGQTGALVEPLMVEAKEYRVGWSVDTYLLPEFRGQGLGRELQQANDAANPIFMSLSMSNANRHIKKSLGATPLDPVSIYVKTLRHFPDQVPAALFNRLRAVPAPARKPLTGMMRILGIESALARRQTARAAHQISEEVANIDPTIEVEFVDEITPEFNYLWDGISSNFRVLVKRDQRYLKRKYDQQPHTEYHRLIARKAGKISGYLMLRPGLPPEPNRGILTDLFTAPDDKTTLHGLLAAGVARLQELGVESILAATNLPFYQQALETFGFRKTGRVTPMIHCRATKEICKSALSPDAWLLGKGDHDWDQFPLG
jgi:GNAT superfamily N-acetyltransferase